MTENTPGPWQFVASPAWGYSTLCNPETGEEVLVPGGQNDEDRPETWMGEEMIDANRALIESAPDLLAALEGLVEIERRDNTTDPAMTATDEHRERTWNAARAAIAKAAPKGTP